MRNFRKQFKCKYSAVKNSFYCATSFRNHEDERFYVELVVTKTSEAENNSSDFECKFQRIHQNPNLASMKHKIPLTI